MCDWVGFFENLVGYSRGRTRQCKNPERRSLLENRRFNDFDVPSLNSEQYITWEYIWNNIKERLVNNELVSAFKIFSVEQIINLTVEEVTTSGREEIYTLIKHYDEQKLVMNQSYAPVIPSTETINLRCCNANCYWWSRPSEVRCYWRLWILKDKT